MTQKPSSKNVKLLDDLLFQMKDVFGKNVRITKDYWNKITQQKHRELTASVETVKETIILPDQVRQKHPRSIYSTLLQKHK